MLKSHIELPKADVVCFTGHRPNGLYGYVGRDAYTPLCMCLRDIISSFAENGTCTFVSGGAQGADQLAFWSVEHVKRERGGISNVVFCPFDGQDSKWHQGGPFGKDEYRMMLDAADHVTYVSHLPSREAYIRRDKAMVDASGAVVALTFDGWETDDSGTAATMRYASKSGVPIVVVNPVDMTLSLA